MKFYRYIRFKRFMDTELSTVWFDNDVAVTVIFPLHAQTPFGTLKFSSWRGL